MTAAPVVLDGRDPVVAAYEALRGRVLAGAPGGPGGVVLLLREGMAAWISGVTAAAPVQPAGAATRRGATPSVSDELRAAVVRVLASMALGRHSEGRA